MNKRQVSILISGRVQGVYFRASSKEVALQLGITGWVRNEPDGSVFIKAEGDSKAIHQFIAWCQIGPLRAMVQHVKVEEGTPENFKSFIIDR